MQPPGSKSITNRALVCAALADGTSTLTGALDSEDTRVMIESLGRLGIGVESSDSGTTLRVHGCGGNIPVSHADLFVSNSGTTIRFLTALCTLGRGIYRLDGIERMRDRPIGDLIAALRQVGVQVTFEKREGFPPLTVNGIGPHGGEVTVRGDISSQFLSGILLAGACHGGTDLVVHVDGELVSKPYVAMTTRVMKSFGVDVEVSHDYRYFDIPNYGSTYRPLQYSIEPDASAASYFWAAAAITGGEVTVDGLSRDSLQGDVHFVECLAQMGCRVDYASNAITVSGRAAYGIDVDMNAISDTAQTLAVVALFANGPTTIRGVAHIRHKETDRIGDLARELRKFGATIEELPDGLRIHPSPLPLGEGLGAESTMQQASENSPLSRISNSNSTKSIEIETYNDHRMAMSFALAGLIHSNIVIRNPGCTAKTYPRFFDDLSRLYGQSSANPTS